MAKMKNKGVKAQDIAKKKARYLDKYMETARHDLSCAAAKISIGQSHHWSRDDPDFDKAYREARTIAARYLEDHAVKRGTKGVRHPVYQQGQLAGYEILFSDGLLQFLLKGFAPDRYRDRVSVDSVNKNESVVIVNHGLQPETADAIREQVLGIKPTRTRDKGK